MAYGMACEMYILLRTVQRQTFDSSHILLSGDRKVTFETFYILLNS